MNNKNFKKLLDDRAKSIPRKIFLKNDINEYTIINDIKLDENKQINSQNDLIIKLEQPKDIQNKYASLMDDRKNEEQQRNIEYERYMNILEEQKRKTRELLERLNIK
jgi:hypothetical protein